MGLTKISGKVIQDNCVISGVVTASTFTGPLTGNVTGNVTGNLTGNVTGNTSGTAGGLSGSPSITVTDITSSGNVSIAGTLTYEDVTNVDSIGIVTAKSGIHVTGGSVGIGTDDPTEKLHVLGDARVTGILTVGTASVTIDGTNSRIGIESSSPRVAVDASQATDGIALPVGTQAQRPTGVEGYMRFNSESKALEIYNGTNWVEIISDYFPQGSVVLG